MLTQKIETDNNTNNINLQLLNDTLINKDNQSNTQNETSETTTTVCQNKQIYITYISK